MLTYNLKGRMLFIGSSETEAVKQESKPDHADFLTGSDVSSSVATVQQDAAILCGSGGVKRKKSAKTDSGNLALDCLDDCIGGLKAKKRCGRPKGGITKTSYGEKRIKKDSAKVSDFWRVVKVIKCFLQILSGQFLAAIIYI